MHGQGVLEKAVGNDHVDASRFSKVGDRYLLNLAIVNDELERQAACSLASTALADPVSFYETSRS